MPKKLSVTQRAILSNVRAGRPPCHGMPPGRSASGGWDQALRSCFRHGWLAQTDLNCAPFVTVAGGAALDAS